MKKQLLLTLQIVTIIGSFWPRETLSAEGATSRFYSQLCFPGLEPAATPRQPLPLFFQRLFEKTPAEKYTSVFKKFPETKPYAVIADIQDPTMKKALSSLILHGEDFETIDLALELSSSAARTKFLRDLKIFCDAAWPKRPELSKHDISDFFKSSDAQFQESKEALLALKETLRRHNDREGEKELIRFLKQDYSNYNQPSEFFADSTYETQSKIVSRDRVSRDVISDIQSLFAEPYDSARVIRLLAQGPAVTKIHILNQFYYPVRGGFKKLDLSTSAKQDTAKRNLKDLLKFPEARQRAIQLIVDMQRRNQKYSEVYKEDMLFLLIDLERIFNSSQRDVDSLRLFSTLSRGGIAESSYITIIDWIASSVAVANPNSTLNSVIERFPKGKVGHYAFWKLIGTGAMPSELQMVHRAGPNLNSIDKVVVENMLAALSIALSQRSERDRKSPLALGYPLYIKLVWRPFFEAVARSKDTREAMNLISAKAKLWDPAAQWLLKEITAYRGTPGRFPLIPTP